MGDFWQKPPDVGGLGDTTEIVTPSGEKLTFHAAPVHDDFATIAEEPENPRLLCDSPCLRCGTVHVREGAPMCFCVKCGKFGRIVWCGQCVPCTYENYCGNPHIGKDVADQIFSDYVKWKHAQEMDKSKVNKEPWEK